MLQVESIVKSRTLAGGETIRVLSGVSFSVAAGRVACILGPSGGGKSTMLRLVNRLEDPDEGRIALEGTDVREIPVLDLRRRVGFVPQKSTLFEGTVYENVIAAYAYAKKTPPAQDDERLGRLMDLVRLERSILARRSRELSGGQQQRVSVIRTLLPGPQILLMDEPTASLDPRTADQFVGELRALLAETQTTVLIATHDLAAARRIADDVLFLDGGRIVEQGETRSLLDDPRTGELRAFLQVAEREAGAPGESEAREDGR